MRSLLFSVVFLFFVAGCSEDSNQITHPQNDMSLNKDGDCVLYDFNDMIYDTYVSFYKDLTFWTPEGSSTGVTCNTGYFSSRYPVVIKFPIPNIYNYLSVEIDHSVPVIVTYSDDNTYTTIYDPGTTSVFEHTATNGKYLSSIQIFYSDDFSVDNLQLCIVNTQCPAPEITLESSQSELWPANNKEIEVTFSGNLINECGNTTYKLTDEYGEYSYTGDVESGDYSITLKLMASRKGNDIDGRKYTFTIKSENTSGTVTKSVDVIVPHNHKKK